MLIRVELNPHGPRLFVGRLRVHHWHAGCALIAWGARWVWGDRSDIHLGR